jgi:RimJ/RimL family protein N-acetyltransferase
VTLGPAAARPALEGPPLATRRIRLRALTDRDRAFVYHLMTPPQPGGRVRFGGATPSPDKVLSTLWDSVLAQFIVERVDGNEPIGLVAISSANFRDGFAYLSALGSAEAVGRGLVMEAVLLAFHYAFLTWPMRKIYMEATEDSYQQFRKRLGTLFSEEGRLRGHTFWNGRYADVLILAVYRETWEAEAADWLRRLHLDPPELA